MTLGVSYFSVIFPSVSSSSSSLIRFFPSSPFLFRSFGKKNEKDKNQKEGNEVRAGPLTLRRFFFFFGLFPSFFFVVEIFVHLISFFLLCFFFRSGCYRDFFFVCVAFSFSFFFVIFSPFFLFGATTALRPLILNAPLDDQFLEHAGTPQWAETKQTEGKPLKHIKKPVKLGKTQ